jgi:hypothetical protein
MRRSDVPRCREFGTPSAYTEGNGRGWASRVLRIFIQEDDKSIGFTLVGRLAGPWVAELEKAWNEVSTRLDGKKLSLDLRDLTYSDDNGKKVLREMFARAKAELITGSDWSHHLADEIKDVNRNYASGRA